MTVRWPPSSVSKLRSSHQDTATAAFGPPGTLFNEAASTAWVALDANVLLKPYSVTKQSLESIADVYRLIETENRLIVPGQVAREYARNRQRKLADLLSGVLNVKSQAKIVRPDDSPLWSGLPAFQSAHEAWEKVQEPLKEYQQALDEFVTLVRRFPWSDPVSEAYGSIFTSQVVVDPKFDEQHFLAEHTRRQTAKIPPGYSDSAKSDTGYGDLLIWATLLHATNGSGRDLIFVTEEKKSDWWHQASGSPLAPRFELVDEYRQNSGGGTLHLSSLAGLLEALEVSASVVADVRATGSSGGVMIDALHGAAFVTNTDTLLVRGSAGFGVVKPILQSAPEDGEELFYNAWFSSNLDDFAHGLARMPVHSGGGRAGATDPMVSVGPYEIPWSGSGENSGWFYYHEWNGAPSSRPYYELAVVGEQMDYDYFRSGTFHRGQSPVNDIP